MMVASDIEVAQTIGFGIIALVMVLCGVGVVASRNVVHAALSLVAVMAGAAAQYVLLAAEFVAVTQVLVYIGAVMVLFLFGVMLTRAKVGKEPDLNNRYAKVAAPVSLLLFGVLVYVLLDGFSDTTFPTTTGSGATPQSTQMVSDLIFKPYLLPFWALSFVLLAAVIGAIVLARKD
ncbi:MAG: NADH-quinone oxidoreductase subunit J [Acidobacteria bacterium]|nr:NADH-quinone oxidoreductase subunit J [Acidobacteriota bacterium]